MNSPQVSVILPAYNCAEDIAQSVCTLKEFFRTSGLSGEVIVVDDGSKDGTAEAVPTGEGIVLLRLQKNSGKGAAIRLGMLKAQGQARIFTDADLPFGIESILRASYLILERGHPAVIGDRMLPGSTYSHAGLLRRGISAFAGFVFRTLITGGFYDTQCGLKGFRGDVAEGLFSITRIHRFATDVEMIYLLLKYHFDLKRMPVQLRAQSPSTVRVIRDSLRAAVDILLLPWNWRRGRYHSPALAEAFLREDKTLNREIREKYPSIRLE